MKTLIILLLSIVSFSIQAQNITTAEQNSIESMIRMYDMDIAQSAQYRTIVTTKIKDLKSLASKEIDAKSKKDEELVIEENFETAFKSILNEKQLKIYEVQKQLANKIKDSAKAPSQDKNPE